MEKVEQGRAAWISILVHGTLATCQFELVRNLSFQRIMVAAVLAIFPPAMMFLILFGPRLVGATPSIAVPVLLILVLVAIVCFLSLLLWSSTVVDADLEGRTWVYLASRPMGRTSSLMGKFLAALLQCWAVCFVAIMGSFLVARLAGVVDSGAFRQMLAMMAVFGVAAIVYNSILSFLGVLFFKRAMIAGVAWAFASELFIANIPAVVRFVTVRYHIQELVFRWVGWLFPGREGEEFYRDVYGDFGAWFHLAILFGVVTVTMGAALWRINHHEYLSAEES